MVCDAKKEDVDNDKPCLNPYSIGIWSATSFPGEMRDAEIVLILILLEYGLRLIIK